MKIRKNFKRIISCVLAVLLMVPSIFKPLSVYAEGGEHSVVRKANIDGNDIVIDINSIDTITANITLTNKQNFGLKEGKEKGFYTLTNSEDVEKSLSCIESHNISNMSIQAIDGGRIKELYYVCDNCNQTYVYGLSGASYEYEESREFLYKTYKEENTFIAKVLLEVLDVYEEDLKQYGSIQKTCKEKFGLEIKEPDTKVEEKTNEFVKDRSGDNIIFDKVFEHNGFYVYNEILQETELDLYLNYRYNNTEKKLEIMTLSKKCRTY